LRIRVSVFATLWLVAFMAVLGPGAEARQTPPVTATTQKTGDEVVGASIAHPAKWTVQREGHTFDGTYGFTLWKPEDGSVTDHGGRPAVRVALAYGMKPGLIEEKVRETVAAYPDLSLEREEVSVAENGYEGVAVGPIPGSTPSTEVYVPVNGRVYRINVYGEELGEDGRELLSTLRFEPPSQAVGALDLPPADAAESYYAAEDQELVERELAAREAATVEAPETTEESFDAAARSGGGETRIAEGCWRAHPDFFFQTQHGSYANVGWYPKRAARHRGWTKIGLPNYWGQYTHGNLGYGRCTKRIYTNDKYAIDYPLDRGNAIFSPFKSGTVTFAGRNTTHRDYGILVTIRASNNKYVSLSAHLNGLARGIRRGAKVTERTIIGYAGNTGGPNIPVGYPHLHQAYYRYPSYNRDGSPYGGAGLQVIRHHYVGTAADTRPGVYIFGPRQTAKTKTKREWISN
jgi:murein DD-endopeptidase MepM/ murein hydrolase activator NlpD